MATEKATIDDTLEDSETLSPSSLDEVYDMNKKGIPCYLTPDQIKEFKIEPLCTSQGLEIVASRVDPMSRFIHLTNHTYTDITARIASYSPHQGMSIVIYGMEKKPASVLQENVQSGFSRSQ